MKVSVIIPSYNHADFLVERIQSVKDNIRPGDEIIFIDDCSPDDSADIARELLQDHKKSRIIVNNKNSGRPSEQWRKGIDLAKNDLIWIAESDDVADRGFLEKLRNKMVKDEEIRFSFTKSKILSRNGINDRIIKEQDSYGLTESKIYDGKELFATALRYRNIVFNASSCLFRKNDIDISNHKYIFDWEYWIELSLTGKVFFLNEELNYFRSHENTTRNYASSTEELRKYIQYERLIEKVKRIGRPVNFSNYTWMIKELYEKKDRMNYLYYIIKMLPNLRRIQNEYSPR